MITTPCVRQFMTFTRTAERASWGSLRLWGWCVLATLIACDGTPTEPTLEATTLTAHIDVAAGTVTLHGRVSSREPIAETWFEWGTNVESLRHQNTNGMASNTYVSSVTMDVLEPATTYYYRFAARNSVGTRHGQTLSFVAPAPLPPVPPQGPEAITSHALVNVLMGTVTLYGRVVVPGGATVETWFEWGTSAESLRHQIPIRMASILEGHVSSAVIDSLELATTYYYRFVARNSAGTHYGETLSFATPARWVDATLAFVRRGDIYIYTPADGSTVRLTTGGNFGHPTWSPDGTRIAFGQEHVWPSSIYVSNADGSGLQRVGDGWSPAWSPDGRRLAFAALRDGQGAIFVTSVDDPTQPAIRIGFDRGQHDSPSWSPDGTRIAFISDWAAFDFAFDVYIANADGSGEVEQLTNGFFGNQSNWPTFTIYAQPSWSPDGRSLAVVECDEWQFFDCADSRVGVMSADGSGFRVLTNTAGFARPGWTHDGSAVVFSRTCWYHDCASAIFEVALDGTNVRLLMEDAHSGVFRR
jgi:hypothetical protein